MNLVKKQKLVDMTFLLLVLSAPDRPPSPFTASAVGLLALPSAQSEVSAPQTEPRPGDGTQGDLATGKNVPRPVPGRMFVTGRALDMNGKPVPDAMVVVHARSLSLADAPSVASRTPLPIGHGRADTSGRFRVAVPRTSSSSHEAFGAIALAPGHGVGWVVLAPDDEKPTADITLPAEQVIQCRLFDLKAQPIPDVTLAVP